MRFVQFAVLLLALFGGAVVVLILWFLGASPVRVGPLAGVALTMGLFAGPLGVWGAGIAIARPVGLRLDRDGVSGYLIPALRWSDIRAVTLIERPTTAGDSASLSPDRTTPYLALRLVDPNAWRRRCSPMQRCLNWRAFRPKNWHILVLLDDLDATDPRAIAAIASNFHQGL